MPEIVCAFLWTEGWHDGANSVLQGAKGSGCGLAQKSFDLCEYELDRVKVGRILRQVTKRRARGFDEFPHPGYAMGPEIVDDHHVTAFERGHQALLKIDAEHRAGHRSIEYERRYDAVMTQTGNEGDGFPFALRHMVDHALAALAAAVQPRHIGGCGGLVDKHQV